MGKLETTVAVLVEVVVGLAFLVVGLGGATYQLLHTGASGVNVKAVGMFMGLAILGALIMPAIFSVLFPRVKSFYVLVFPNGIPIPGGRRSGDPPAGPVS